MKNNKFFARIAVLLFAVVLTFSIVPASLAAEEFHASGNCINLIRQFDKCYLEAYKDPAGIWTIGYGHTKNVTPGQKLASEAEAVELLRQDLPNYENAVNRYIANGTIRFEMNQNRFDALVSFTMNCGAGNTQMLVKGRTADVVAQKMLTYTKGGGKILPVLVQRREAERALFLR